MARLLRDQSHDIIRCNRHLRITPRIRLGQKHAVHEHRSVCDDASRVWISGYDDCRKFVTQSGECPVDLCSDIAAQRRINALVEEHTPFFQLQKSISDPSKSLLWGQSAARRRVGQHIGLVRCRSGQTKETAHTKTDFLEEHTRSIRPGQIIRNNNASHRIFSFLADPIADPIYQIAMISPRGIAFFASAFVNG